MANEIERKFLVDRIPPDVLLDDGLFLRQGYVAQDGDVEVRVRITEAQAWLTVKAGAGLSRTEVEVPLPAGDADALWVHTMGRRVVKRRFRAPAGDRVADIDVFRETLEGLCTAEVEFPSEAAAAAYTPPAWFGRELTGDPGWSNASLARFGLPGSSTR